MKIALGELRQLIQEALLVEYTLSDDVSLYHRSKEKFKVGDILTAQTDPKTGEHWMASKDFEKRLEEFRKKNYPELPSRLNCVYATFKPRSRFLRKGNLYRIKPIGKTHVTDSHIIDQMQRNAEDRYPGNYLFEEYWEGIEPGRRDMNNAEVLMQSARVVEVVDEKHRMQPGMKIYFGDHAPKIRASLMVSKSKELGDYVYASDGNTKISLEDGLKRLEVPGIFASRAPHKGDYSVGIPMIIGPEFEGFIVSSFSNDPESSFRGVLNVHVSPGDSISEGGLYIEIDESEKFIKAFRAGLIEHQ